MSRLKRKPSLAAVTNSAVETPRGNEAHAKACRFEFGMYVRTFAERASTPSEGSDELAFPEQLEARRRTGQPGVPAARAVGAEHHTVSTIQREAPKARQHTIGVEGAVRKPVRVRIKVPALVRNAVRVPDGRRELPYLLEDMEPPTQIVHKGSIWRSQATGPPTEGLLYNLQIIDYMQKPQGCFHDATTSKISSLRRNVLQKAHCTDTKRIIGKMLLHRPRTNILPGLPVLRARAPICADGAE